MEADYESNQGALAQFEDRLRRDVADMVKVLTADVPVFVERTVRKIFEQSAQADAMSDSDLAKLKKATGEASAKLGAEVERELEPFEVWLWEGSSVPTSPDGLNDHPRVGAVLDRVGATLRSLLEDHGIPAADPKDANYRLPAYFVAGHFMKSLVANYWRSLADFHDLGTRLEEESRADERQRRSERWDNA